MKISRLLVLSALWAVSLCANAADLVEREAPTVSDVATTPVAFEADHQYLLYNTGAGMFFSQGNAWGTKASGNANQEAALRVKFVKYVPDGGEWDLKSYIFKIYSSVRSDNQSWHECFFDSETAMFVDRGSQANLYWEIDDMGGNVYRLKAADDANTASATAAGTTPIVSDGLWVGWDENVPQDGSNLSDFYDNANAWPLSPKVETNVDWVFYDAAIFDAYEKSVELKNIIESAEAQGVDVSAAVAVYNDLSATAAQMEAAIKALQEAMQGAVASGTADNPTDATSYITNPNFDNASPAGWSGKTPNMVGSGSHGPADVPEFYSQTFDAYQDLSGLPNGVYGMQVFGFYRSGGTDDAYTNWKNGTNYNAYFYAVTGEADSLTVKIANPFEAQCKEDLSGATEFGTSASTLNVNGLWIPNDPSAGRLFFERGWLKHNLFFVVEDGKARIGLRKDVTIDTDWTVYDSFSLKFYGNTVESYKKWAELCAPTFPEDATVTASVIEAYQAAVATQVAGVTDKASALAAVEALKEAAKAVQENISLWAEWQETVEQARTKTADGHVCGMDVSDYVEQTAEEILEEMKLDNEGLKKEIEDLKNLIQQMEECKKNALQDGDDVTNFLANPGFDEGMTGWTYERTGTNAGNTRVTESCIEAWHNNGFDIYQVVRDLPKGVYEISVQGYVRYLDGQQAVTAWESEDRPDIPVYVYMNSAKTKFANIFDVPMEEGFYESPCTWLTGSDGMCYPDNMTAAHKAFDAGYYTKSAYGLVARDGDTLRIGVKGTPENCWPIWDNFKLTYRANNPDVLRPALEEALAMIDTSNPMGKSVYEKAKKVTEDAQAALAANDGNAMFAALTDVYALTDEILESVELFKKLNTAAETLMEKLNDSNINQNYASEASNLVAEVQSGIESHSIEDEEVPALLEKLAAFGTKIYLPYDVDTASDDVPADVTAVIQTPGFEKDGENSVEGWTEAKGSKNFGNDDTQKSAFALEFWNQEFDFYQDIIGLPAGTYEVKASAFCRIGGKAEDYAATQANPNATEAFLYTVADEVTNSAPIPSLLKGALTEDRGLGGDTLKVGVAEGDTIIYYFPADMVSSVAFFEQEDNAYTASVITKVSEAGKLRIGIKKEENTNLGWCIFDSFELFYYGANSQKEVSGDGIDELNTTAPVIKVEFFSLDGRKVSPTGKGIVIMKQTMQNGNVIVRKIQK